MTQTLQKPRPFLATITFVLVAVALLFCPLSGKTGQRPDRPNVLIIVADDLGYADMSFLPQSPKDVKTPGIDRLAKEGTYFTNAYATSPICSPSRCGLITGRYQQRWGNYWYGQGGLPRTELTLAQILKRLGYRTFKIGKTHLNGGPAQHPLDHGFDEFLGFIHHTWDYIRLNEKDLQAYKKRAKGKKLGILNVGPLERNRGKKVSYENGFTTKIFTDEAIKIIQTSRRNKTPFYIQLEHNAVHMPTYVAHPDYARKAGYEQPAWDRNAKKWTFPFWDPRDITWQQWHKAWGHLGKVDPLGRKRYLAQLMAMDDGITRILDSLEKTRQRQNTIVIFLSDNGGTINTYANNSPLSGYKYMFGEGGLRIPFIVSYPGRLPQGKTRSGLTSAMDVFPTVVELAQGKLPKNLDGKSLVASLSNSKNDIGHDHICFANGKGTWVVRQGDWRLIQSKGWVHKNYLLDKNNIAKRTKDYVYPKGLLLFNLKDDIGETKNVAAKYPERVAQMRVLYERWQGQMAQPKRKRRKQ
ncbi:MAG: sulfatase [Gemmataceae bacterium]